MAGCGARAGIRSREPIVPDHVPLFSCYSRLYIFESMSLTTFTSSEIYSVSYLMLRFYSLICFFVSLSCTVSRACNMSIMSLTSWIRSSNLKLRMSVCY